MDRLKVWSYWENPPGQHTPAYLQLCHDLLQHKCPSCDVILVTDRTLKEYLNPFDFHQSSVRMLDEKKNPIALKADYIRARLLNEYGGVWIDIDNIVPTDIGPIVSRILKKHDFASMREGRNNLFTNGFMASRKRGVTIQQYLTSMGRIIESKKEGNTPYEWTELGEQLLSETISNIKSDVFAFSEDEHWPVHWTNSDQLESNDLRTYRNLKENKNIVRISLFNARRSEQFKSLPANLVLNGSTVISRLLRDGLQRDGRHIRRIKASSLNPLRQIELRKRNLPPVRRPLLTGSDLYTLMEMGTLGPIAYMTEMSQWSKALSVWQKLTRLLSYRADSAVDKLLDNRNLLEDNKVLNDFAKQHAVANGRHRMIIYRALSDRCWRPNYRLVGEENLANSAKKGRGTILWVAHFAFNSLVLKIAMAEAGYSLHHVSRPEHGFSKSRLGIQYLNPLRVGLESRFLAGRIVIDRGNPGSSAAQIKKALAENHFVSITAGNWEGHNVARVPFLNGEIELAIGAAALGQQLGIDVLPVFVVLEPESDEFVTEIQAPLDGTSSQLGDAVPSAIRDFADRLESRVLQYPEQWSGWKRYAPWSAPQDAI